MPKDTREEIGPCRFECSDLSGDPAACAGRIRRGRSARRPWCDGPPFAYQYGFTTARSHLRALGAPEPELTPYAASQHEPIEEIPIEPEDEQSVWRGAVEGGGTAS